MTIKELSQLYHLRREVEMDRQRLVALEERALPGAQRLSGLPGSGYLCGGDCRPAGGD